MNNRPLWFAFSLLLCLAGCSQRKPQWEEREPYGGWAYIRDRNLNDCAVHTKRQLLYVAMKRANQWTRRFGAEKNASGEEPVGADFTDGKTYRTKFADSNVVIDYPDYRLSGTLSPDEFAKLVGQIPLNRKDQVFDLSSIITDFQSKLVRTPREIANRRQ